MLGRLQLAPWDITRTGEPLAAELGLALWTRDETTRIRWIEALARPALVHRVLVGITAPLRLVSLANKPAGLGRPGPGGDLCLNLPGAYN